MPRTIKSKNFSAATIMALENRLYSKSVAYNGRSKIFTCHDCSSSVIFSSKNCRCKKIKYIKCSSCKISYPRFFYVAQKAKIADGKVNYLKRCACCRTASAAKRLITLAKKEEDETEEYSYGN